jgi:WD40 repeat protein
MCVSATLILAILLGLGMSEKSPAQQKDAEKEKRIGDIKKEIADLRGKLAALEAELAKLQPAEARSVDIKPERVLKGHADSITLLHFTPASNMLLSFARHEAFWWVMDAACTEPSPVEVKQPVAAACTSDLKTQAYGRYPSNREDRRLCQISVQRKDKPFEIRVGSEFGIDPLESLGTIAIAPDGTTLAYLIFNEKNLNAFLYVHDLEKDKPVNSFEVHATRLLYTPDGNYLVSRNINKVDVWKTSTLKLLRSHELTNKTERKENALAIDKDSKTLAVANGPAVKLMGLADGKEQFTLVHSDDVSCLAFSADGKYLATGGYANEIWIWEAVTGKKLAAVDAHMANITSLAFSPDGKTLASGSSDKTIKLWSMAKILGK